MKKLISGLITLLIYHFVIGQSAWNIKENSWFAQLNVTSIGPYSDLFVNGNETAITPREISDNTIQFYVEYGINNKTSLSLGLPVKYITTGSQTTLGDPIISENKITSLGNIGFGIKRNLYEGGVVVSAGLYVEANTGRYNDASGIRTGYDAWTITPAVIIGKSFDNLFLQSSLSTGFRTNNYSQFFRGNAELGYKFMGKLWAIFYLDYKASFDNGTIVLPENNLSTSLYVNDQEYFGYGLKAIYDLTEQFGITAGFGGAFSANAEARKAAFNLGLFMNLSPNK